MGIGILTLFSLPFLAFIYAVYYFFNVSRVRYKVTKLGLLSCRGVPLLGNALDMTKAFGAAPGVPSSVYTLEFVSGIKKVFSKDLFYFQLGPYCYIALTRPDEIEVLLADNQQLNKTDDYDYLNPWLGHGLLSSSPQKWKRNRRMLTPAFHFRILDDFQSTMSDYSDIMINRLRSEVGKAFTNLEPFIASCTLDIIAGTSLGVDVNAQKGGSSTYVQALQDASTNLFIRMMAPWLWPEPIFWLSPEGRKTSKSLKIISSFIKKVIREKKDYIKAHPEKVSTFFEDNPDNKKIRRAFLECMLIHNMITKDEQFSDQDIEDEVNTFTFAGHDTTTSAVTWTLYLLGLHPEIQDKAYEEIESILGGDTKRPIAIEDIKKLDYLTRVIKESMRLYPPVPFFGRKLNSDFSINGVTLPKDVRAVVVPPILHRNPDIFPEPEIFDPDRFLITNRHPYSYVPFSAGPRNCIGQRFAMNEMKTVVCNVLRNYKLTSLDPRDKVLVCADLVSRPHKPIRTKIEHRVQLVA